MFSPFLTQNFTLQLQNQIQNHFQSQMSLNHSSQPQSRAQHNDPLQQQTFQNKPIQNDGYHGEYIPEHLHFFSNNTSNTNTPSHADQDGDLQEYTRKPTFFGNPFFGSDQFMNHIKKQVGNYCEDSPTSNENPEKACTQAISESNIFSLQAFNFLQSKDSGRIRQQNQDNSREKMRQQLPLNENQQISQTELMFEKFEQEQLQSKRLQAPAEVKHFPSTVSQQSQQESFQKHFFEESIVQEINGTIIELPQKQSFLKQISSKIKNSRVQLQKPNPNKFNLKQFNKTITKAKELSSKQKAQVQNHELYRAILEMVTKKENPKPKTSDEMQNLVQKLKVSILPHFQKLQNDYTQKITQMNELVQGMILLNLNKQQQPKPKSIQKYERRFYNMNQSVVQINLNDDETSDKRFDHASKGPLEQIEEERQRKQLITSVPMITRTDSSQGVFVSYHSREQSQIDILASIDSKCEPIKILEANSCHSANDI